MNIIISGNSDEAVLKDQETDGGLRNYWLYVLVLGLLFGSFEVIVHLTMRVNVWDNMLAQNRLPILEIITASVCEQCHSPLPTLSLRQSVNETDEIRYDYNDPQLGTCTETIQGGGHFRYWTQNGPGANSGAIFMASSYELPLTGMHNRFVILHYHSKSLRWP